MSVVQVAFQYIGPKVVQLVRTRVVPILINLFSPTLNPAALAATAVGGIALNVISLGTDQLVQMVQTTDRVVTAVTVYCDNTDIRGEQREVLGAEALHTMPERLDEANRVVQQAVGDQELQARDHLQVASDLVGLIEQFRANVDASKQFTNDLRALNQHCELIILLQEDVERNFGNLPAYLSRT